MKGSNQVIDWLYAAKSTKKILKNSYVFILKPIPVIFLVKFLKTLTFFTFATAGNY